MPAQADVIVHSTDPKQQQQTKRIAMSLEYRMHPALRCSAGPLFRRWVNTCAPCDAYLVNPCIHSLGLLP